MVVLTPNFYSFVVLCSEILFMGEFNGRLWGGGVGEKLESRAAREEKRRRKKKLIR